MKNCVSMQKYVGRSQHFNTAVPFLNASRFQQYQGYLDVALVGSETNIAIE